MEPAIIESNNNRLQIGLILFFIFVSIEAFIAGIWLLKIPADPKNAIFGGYSLQRLYLIFGLFAASLITMILGTVAWKGKLLLKFNSKHQIIFFNGVCILSLAGLLFLVLPIKSILPELSAIHTRVFPIIAFITLVGVQGIFLVALVYPDSISKFLANRFDSFRRWTNKPSFGYMCLGLSMVFSIMSLFYRHYHIIDEGDTVTIGWLISEGWVLYDDVFSHHFPLPYMFVSLVIRIFGSSILAIRFSMIILRIIVFLVAMRVSRYYFALGLAALVWSLWGIFYLSNNLVYDSFSGFLILGVLAISIAILNFDIEPGVKELITIGILTGFAVLTDPLMLIPVGFTIIFLSAFLRSWDRTSVITGLSHLGIITAGIAISMLSFYLLFGRLFSIPGMYFEGVIFNSEIYAKYYPQATISNFIRPILTILGISNREWFARLDPFFPLHDYLLIDNSLFTGFFYRASVLLACIIFFFRKNILSGIYLFLFAASLLVRQDRYFHSSPFVLVTIFISSLLIFMLLNSNYYFRIQNFSSFPKISRKAANAGKYLLLAVLLFVIALLSIRSGWYLLEKRSKMSYEANFGSLVKRAQVFKRKTCNQDNAKILDYPLNTYTYFLSQIHPASEYIFMTPWVAEIAQEQVIQEIESQPVLIHFPEDEEIWNFRLGDYQGELLDELNMNYIQNDKYFYSSPELIELCFGLDNEPQQSEQK